MAAIAVVHENERLHALDVEYRLTAVPRADSGAHCWHYLLWISGAAHQNFGGRSRSLRERHIRCRFQHRVGDVEKMDLESGLPVSLAFCGVPRGGWLVLGSRGIARNGTPFGAGLAPICLLCPQRAANWGVAAATHM